MEMTKYYGSNSKTLLDLLWELDVLARQDVECRFWILDEVDAIVAELARQGIQQPATVIPDVTW